MATNKQRPTMGRIVHYTLAEADANHINAARERSLVDGNRILQGNFARTGDTYPATIIRVGSDGEDPPCNLQVHLDGNDAHWATSMHEHKEGEPGTPGTWAWPPRTCEPKAESEAKSDAKPEAKAKTEPKSDAKADLKLDSK
jgi:hypothetical protein